jgi:hypothetical protein
VVHLDIIKYSNTSKIWPLRKHTLLPSALTTWKSMPPHNLQMCSPSTLPPHPYPPGAEPRAHWPLQFLVLVIVYLTPSEDSTIRQNLVLFKQTTHSTTKSYIHSSMKLNNIVSISSHLIICQSIAHTKMCPEFNLDSYIHSQIQP